MTVDVIVPCYNYGRFVGEALRSVAAQTLAPDRVLVLDDGSEDDSLAILHQLRGELEFELVTQPNAGLVATLRRAVQETSSDLFVTLSADDRLHPEFLEATTALLQATPDAGYCYTDMRRFGEIDDVLASAPFDAARLVYRDNYISGGALMRRTAYLQTQGFSELLAYEDWDLWLSFLDAGFEGVHLARPLYEWRQHGPSRNRIGRREEFLLRRRIQLRHRGLLMRHAGQELPAALRRGLKRWRPDPPAA
ncbi:MAG: glycosyl transferase family 2 [Frankiales bacterium]|nr:glycosyl transferase family 2 [Frankiales bacterium]